MEQVTDRTIEGERSRSGKTSGYARVVLELLSRLKRGHLRIMLPWGETLEVGDPSSSDRALLRIRDEAFFRRAVLSGDVGFGESYVAGEWDTDNLTGLLKLMLRNLDDLPLSGASRKPLGVNLLKAANRLRHLLRRNSRRGSARNIGDHYDLSNDFYRLWLDASMTYSSALFVEGSATLEEAQTEKIDRLCRKLGLAPGIHVLEIGTGWGSFAVHAAKHYGASVTTVTVSREQYVHARDRVEREGVGGLVEVRLQDYRTVEGTFDRIVSVEMLEAVGHEYLPAFFSVCHRVLRKDGLMALQVITSPDARYDEFRSGVDWIQKHIFPGSLLPSIGAIVAAVNATGDMHLHHLEEFGRDYARTLAEWRRRFNARLAQVRDLGFGDEFIRKWNYYLSYCEAGFAMRNITVVQMTLTRPNNLTLA